MTAFVVAHRDEYGLEPICNALQVAVTAVRSCLARPISARELADEALKPKVLQLWEDNYRVYGARRSGRRPSAAATTSVGTRSPG